MRILIACEFSGIVRTAFAMRGHDAWSCDLLDTELPGKHIKGDVRNVLNDGWDMIIAFPPCTALCLSGNHKYSGSVERKDALEFVLDIMDASAPKLCIENPVGAISSAIQQPTQIIQPWQFGHDEIKRTCLWLYGLPKLVPTSRVAGRTDITYSLASGYYAYPTRRWRNRSRTFSGIALAMAEQWG
jgi:hypothetical protein